MGLYRWALLKIAGFMGMLKPRRYRVTLFGESLGTYFLPRGHHMANPTAEDRPVLCRPFRSSLGENYHLYWLEPNQEGGAKFLHWYPETPTDRDAADRFYHGAHGLRPDGTFDPSKQLPLPSRTTEELRLIAAVRANRDAAQPYLDYAKWLSAKNDSYGEYIRLTWEIERFREGTPEREKLEERRFKVVQKHGVKWVVSLTDVGLFPGFPWAHLHDPLFSDDTLIPDLWYGKKGVIEELDIDSDAHVFPHNAARMFAGAPFLRKLSVNNLDITVATLAPLPGMAQIEHLDLSIGGGTPDDYRPFAESPHFGNLRELKLMGMTVGAEGADHLSRAAWLANVRALDLGACAITDDGADALAASPNVANLGTLLLANNQLTDRGVTALAQSPHLTSLTELNLSGSYQIDDGLPWPGFSAAAMTALGNAVFARGLKSFALDHNLLTAEAAQALAAGQFSSLRALSINNNVPLAAAGVTALVGAAWFRQLEAFSAASTHGTDATVSALAALGFIPLRTLDLTDNDLTDAGVTALVRSNAASKLVKLTLSYNPFGASGAKAIADSPLGELEELDLANVKIGPAGAKALAASPHLKKLKRLVVMDESVGLAGREALMKRFTDQVVSCY